ncbi:MAG: DUF4410 domain-containing protein [Candidatus Eisenbacteria sp.]|nr:DUF4410 domain-containing protein [Candidatus Eisenbacteria bacterium]
MHRSISWMTAVVFVLAALSGCAQYRITQDLTQPIEQPANCSIGEIGDGLPVDMAAEDRPSLENIGKLKNYLREKLGKKKVFASVMASDPNAGYEVVGAVLEYKKGSGCVRYIGLFGAGNAKLTVELRLIDKKSGDVLFAGNFKQKVSSWMESGAKTFERVADDFAKALEKQWKKQQRGK